MKSFLAFAFILFQTYGFAQADTSLRLRAFPISDYFVEVNDSIKIVQIDLPDGFTIPLKQAGILFGVYSTSIDEAVQKAAGKCQLIKDNFHYFGMTASIKDWKPVAGEIIYTFMKRTPVYEKHVIPLASHFTGILNVYGQRFFDRYLVFNQWTEADEKKFMDSVRADIQFTGQYMLENQPTTDKIIGSGENKGQSTFYIMAEAQNNEIADFFTYMVARPRIYAGKEWKISEIFATWLSEGSPKIAK